MASGRRKEASRAAPRSRVVLIGRDAFDKISAIEGIKPSDEALRRSEEFDRIGLDADERRRRIISAHKPKS